MPGVFRVAYTKRIWRNVYIYQKGYITHVIAFIQITITFFFLVEAAALRILMLTWIDIFVARTKTGAMFRNISFQNKLLFREQHGVCFQLHAHYVHG